LTTTLDHKPEGKTTLSVAFAAVRYLGIWKTISLKPESTGDYGCSLHVHLLSPAFGHRHHAMTSHATYQAPAGPHAHAAHRKK
jgi:dethiobiotin synthetase